MNFKSWFRGGRFVSTTSQAKRPGQSGRKTTRCAKPLLETLEDRLAPAAFIWNNKSGGDWETQSNWTPNGLPGANDDVTITGLNSGASVTHSTGTDSVHNVTLGTNLTLSGGSLTVDGNVTIQAGYTITDSATLNIGAVTVAIQDSNYDGTFGIVVNGTMSASGASFTRLSNSNGNDNSQLLVNAGGKLTASNSNFDWDNVVLANGSVQLISTDITNNIFGLTAASTVLSVPITDVPFLTNNKSFEDVDINAGSLNGGQSVALNLMGTATTVNLRYVFPGAFEVKPNATLSIGDGVSALIRYAQTITVDSGGTLSFGAAAVAIQDSNYDGTFGIVVNGTMSTSGASFTRLSNSNGNDNSQLLVNAGGKLTASSSTFDWDNVVLANGSVQLISTDITNDVFGLSAASTVLSVPITDVPFLTNNKSFEDVDINAGSLNGGQSVALNLMGTATTVNLRYVFPGAFEVKPNATLSIGDGVSALIRYAQTITVDSGGTLSFGAAAVAIQDSNYDGTFGIVVNGTMSASGASFTRLSNSNGNDNSQLLVNAGGKLTASNSNFDWDNVVLANGSVQLISTDITNDVFGLSAASTVLSVPITDVPFLTNNQSFEDVDINAGSLNGGQSVALNLMGTATTVNLRYVFPGAFEVKPNATLSIGDGVSA